MKNHIFHKGELYKVTLTLELPEGNHRHVSLEDFFPGGWRPINGIFQTERQGLTNVMGSWWTQRESRDDRMLLYRDATYGEEKLTYSYYIRPESVGDFLLPPSLAYFMYQPEIHAYT